MGRVQRTQRPLHPVIKPPSTGRPPIVPRIPGLSYSLNAASRYASPVICQVEINVLLSSKLVLRRGFPTWGYKLSAHTEGARSNSDGTSDAVAVLLIILEANPIIELNWSFTSPCPASVSRSHQQTFRIRIRLRHLRQSQHKIPHLKEIPGRLPPRRPPSAPHSTILVILPAMALLFEEGARAGKRHMSRTTEYELPVLLRSLLNVQLGPGTTRSIRENKGNPQ